MPSITDTRSGKSGQRQEERKFRPEIQGLRAVAVLMVVAYHVWLGRVSGGVDVFLFISAFFLTGQFVSRYERNVTVNLVKHWLHLFKRLLPAVVVVLLGVLLAGRLFLPETSWMGLTEHGVASLTYWENWLLASESVDYYASDHSTASPLQHFWSLSIQGQVFILWPLLMVGAGLVARRFRLRYRVLLAYLFGAVFIASLAFSIWETSTNQALAYFDTFARLWEFALGSLLAISLPFLVLPRAMRLVLGWVGMIAMLACGIILPVQQSFPGFVALWPTLSAALVIVAGFTDSRAGVDRVLSAKPFVRLGDYSYALYLWHWPILVIYLAWSGKAQAGWLSGALVVISALILAVLTTKFVERPVRTSKALESGYWRPGVVIAMSLLLAGGPALAWAGQMRADVAAEVNAVSKDHPGALSLAQGYVDNVDPSVEPVPSLIAAAEDHPSYTEPCGGAWDSAGYEQVNAFCALDPGEAATKTVAVVGNSHEIQMSTAVVELGRQHGWRVISINENGCIFGNDPEQKIVCNNYYASTMRYLQDKKPDAVFLLASRTSYGTPEETLVPSIRETATSLGGLGIEVVGVRDNPRFNEKVPECVASNGADAPECNLPKSSLLAAVSPMDELKGFSPKLHLIDPTDLYCPADTCPAYIGNVLVYLDNNHVSAAYWRTMTPEFGRRVFAALGWDN